MHLSQDRRYYVFKQHWITLACDRKSSKCADVSFLAIKEALMNDAMSSYDALALNWCKGVSTIAYAFTSVMFAYIFSYRKLDFISPQDVWQAIRIIFHLLKSQISKLMTSVEIGWFQLAKPKIQDIYKTVTIETTIDISWSTRLVAHLHFITS